MLFSLFPLFSQGTEFQKACGAAKMPKNSWGLFGGKWEAKTDFCGLGGQI
jgi:hypothetical protein